MNTAKKINIGNFNELETIELFEELENHIEKNNWEHLYDKLYVVSDLETELKKAEEKIEALQKRIENAVKFLDDVQEKLNQADQELNADLE